ncbi:MAG: hypothetical protein LBK60_05795 [Verrucomicrobiales bacterium]|jgi:hypothetical protein|nr:hypothetical protein [Verrucomicrobiales bacterium]
MFQTLASNGNFDPNGTFNYMADFNSQYSILKGTMEAHDTATDSTLSPTHFLDDGDVFHKYVTSSNASLSSTINGYSRVFFITHGQVQNGNYTFLSPDGTWQPTSFFGNLANGAKIVMVTCCDGAIPSGGNVVGGSGSAGDLTWNASMQIAVTQTWDFLYE